MSCLTILVMPMVSLARCVRRTHAELRHDAQKLSHKTLTPRVMCRGEDSMRITVHPLDRAVRVPQAQT